jgi:uncharacterized protein
VGAAAALPVRLRVNVVGDEEREFDRLYQGLLRRDLHAGLQSLDFAPVLRPESAPRTCSFSALSYPDYVLTVRRERRKAMVLGVPMDGAREPEAPLACRATRRHDLVIGPDGLLYKCTNDVGRAGRAYGAVAPGAPAQPANLLPWLMHDCVQDERCARCPALPVCGGGCRHRRRFQPDQFAATGYCEAYLQELADRMQERVRSGGATVAGEQVGQASGRRPA